MREKQNDSDFEQNQAIFAVRNQRNDSDFEQSQAIVAVRNKQNGSDFEQNEAIFAVYCSTCSFVRCIYRCTPIGSIAALDHGKFPGDLSARRLFASR